MSAAPTPLKVIEAGPSENLIDWLTGMLEQAKSGELQGIVAAVEWKDGAVGTGWCASGKQTYRLLGAVEVLRYKLIGSAL